jgi:DNA mismatch endonuclease (patch repair protein)
VIKKQTKKRKKFKKSEGISSLEVRFSQILNKLYIKFIHNFFYKNKEYDFLLPDYNYFIETNGCFFHCCPKHFPLPKYKLQINNKKNDQTKLRNLKFSQEYNLMIIWECEMKDELLVEEKIKKRLLIN